MEKHISYFELLQAFKEGTCPICAISKRMAHRWLDGFLYEFVNSVGVREKLVESDGFCNAHAWQLLEFEDGLGTAIVYQDLLSRFIGRLERYPINGGRPIGRREKVRLKDKNLCPVCQHCEERENAFLMVLVRHLKGDEGFLKAYEASSGLCIPHFERALEMAKDPKAAEILRRVQLSKLKALNEELEEYKRKCDYRFRHEPKGAEADSWRRVVREFVGEREVF
ncbi:MAG: DUF6062 family protein [bacterium]